MERVAFMPSIIGVSSRSSVFRRADCQSVPRWLRYRACISALLFIQAAVSLVGVKAAEEKAGNGAKVDSAQQDVEVDPSLYTRPDVAFEMEREPLTRQLAASDPDAIKRMLEWQHVAVVQLVVPGSSSFDRRPDPPLIPKEFYGLAYMWGGPLYLAVDRPEKPERGMEYFGAEYFAQVAAMIPKEKLPADTLLSSFTKGSGKVPFLKISNRKQPSKTEGYLLEFQILAPTEDEARELASTMLFLFDQGLTRPVQVQLHKSKRAAEVQLEEMRKEHQEAKDEYGQLHEKIRAPVLVNTDSLAELRTQRHLLAVDLAGAKARVSAAERFLEKKAPGQGREHVENLKITAEIELAGLAARQEALDSLIRAGEQRIDLQRRYSEAVLRSNRASESVSKYEEWLSKAEEAIELLGPFQLHGGKVVIRPVKWSADSESDTSR